MKATFTFVGAAHLDQTIGLIGAVHMHRSNPSATSVTPGGVAANIARYIAAHHVVKGHSPHFIGVAASGQTSIVERDFAAWNIRAHLVEKDAGPASYTAVIDQTGDLIIGAADMALYDLVTPDDIVDRLPSTGIVIIDANFPAEVLVAIADALPMAVSLYAGATSIKKVLRLKSILSRLDGLVLNWAEAIALTGGVDPSAMALTVTSQMRPHGFALISDGDKEATLAQSGMVVSRTPPSIQPTNVNGAGDVMAAALFAMAGDGARKAGSSKEALQQLLDDAIIAGAAFAAGESNV